MSAVSRFVLLPTRGFTADEPHNAAAIETFLTTMAEHGPRQFAAAASAHAARFTVLDSIQSNGAKLVSMSPVALMRLKREQPGLRVVPELHYPPARAPRPPILTGAMAFSTRAVLAQPVVKLVVKDEEGNARPLRGVDVIAFSDYAAGKGAQGTSNARGQVALRLPRSVKVLERVYVYPAHSAWPVLLHQWPLSAGAIELPAIALDFIDSRAKAYPKRALADGAGVTVGVIDTGVGPHDALSVAGGMNAVTGEDAADWSDSDIHGTHVAGIIAGHGRGFMGVSPGVTLRAYRVFGKDTTQGASSFAIAKAIDRAVADGCDLLNMSLGGGPDDPTTSEAIKAARAKGVVCVVAAGNEGGPVAWPARHPLALSVSALGFKGLWPAHAMQVQTLTEPLGKEQSYIADFSNTGPEIDLAGPGVGVISCIPHNLFGVMDGTSMACPAVTGAVACRLAADAKTLAMPRDGDRADAIVRLALQAARDMGLPPLSQGSGLAQ